MQSKKLMIDEAIIEIVRSLVTEDEAEIEAMSIALTLLLDPTHVRRATAMRAAIVVSGEIGSRHSEVFSASDVRDYFVQMLHLVSEGVAEHAGALPSVGDA